MHSRQRARQTLDRLPVIGYLLIALLAGMVASTQIDTTHAGWHNVSDPRSAQPLSDAAFLLTPRHRALLWQPDSAAPFAIQSLDDAEDAVDLLLYGNITPEAWRSVPALADSFHIIWIDSGARLRSALIHTSGETLRGPVELASHASTQLSVLPTGDGGVQVFWHSASQRQIQTVALDAEGRPSPVSTLPARDVGYFSAAADSDNVMHLLWLAPDNASTWILHYQTFAPDFDAETVNDTPPRALHALELLPTESIATYALGLDRSHGYAILAIRDAENPAAEAVRTIAFALAAPETVTDTTILLPAVYTVENGNTDNSLVHGPVAALAEPGDGAIAALRWPRPITDQHEDFALAAAWHSPDGWQPVVITFAGGAPTGYQRVAETSADGGPPSLARDADGTLYLSWTGLDHAETRRYTATSAPAQIAPQPVPASGALLARTLASAAIGSILSLTWIIAPALILLLTPPNQWTAPFAYALYSMSKLLLPFQLFTHMPPLFATWMNDTLAPQTVVAITVSGITLLALAVSYIVQHRTARPAWRRWIVFASVDASLTWLIFGPNLIT